MNPQTPDRLPIEVNQDIPRIIYRKQFTITTSTSGSGYVEYEGTVTCDGIKVSAYNDFDMAVKDGSTVYWSPIRTVTSAGENDFWSDIWLDSSDMVDNNSIVKYRYKIRKYGGATTDTYTAWVVLWSTKINDNINLFDTTV